MPGPLEQRGDRVAIGCTPSVTHVQWTGGIRGDKLDVDPEAEAELTPAVSGAGGQDALCRLGQGILGQSEIDEARPGNFGL